MSHFTLATFTQIKQPHTYIVFGDGNWGIWCSLAVLEYFLLVVCPFQHTSSLTFFSFTQNNIQTVTLFNEVILMSEGRVSYPGPILEVEEYFASLGYKCLEHMDVADFMQQVSNPDGSQLYDPSPELVEPFWNLPNIKGLAALFKEREWKKQINDKLESPLPFMWKEGEEDHVGMSKDGVILHVLQTMAVKQRYASSTFRNSTLNFHRFLTLWKQDKRVIVAGVVKNILMGVSVGGVFANNFNEVDLSSIFFQAGLFIMLSTIQTTSNLVIDFPVFMKHHESNFNSVVPFVVGRTMSTVPVVGQNTQVRHN